MSLKRAASGDVSSTRVSHIVFVSLNIKISMAHEQEEPLGGGEWRCPTGHMVPLRVDASALPSQLRIQQCRIAAVVRLIMLPSGVAAIQCRIARSPGTL